MIHALAFGMPFVAQTPPASPSDAALKVIETEPVLWFSGGLLILPLAVVLFFIINAFVNKGAEPASIESKTVSFAGMFLFGLIIVFAQAMAMYYWGGEDSPGEKIFDACKTLMPPLVTLVIGFYFGQAQPQTKPQQPKSKDEAGGQNGYEDESEGNDTLLPGS